MKRADLSGAWGEERAADFLRRHGYEILAANYRTRVGEIDLIARKHRFLAFVEVKLRASDRFAEAREFVTAAKQDRIRSTALLWLEEHGGADSLQPRFDVIEIYAPEGIDTKEPRIIHLKNAF